MPTATRRRASDETPTIEIGGRTYTQAQLETAISEVTALRRDLKAGRITAAVTASQARGVPPVVVNMINQIMQACDPAAQATLNLTGPGANGEAEPVECNFFSAMELLLSVTPGRIQEEIDSEDYTLDTSGQRNGATGNPYTASDDAMGPDEAEELARQRRAELNAEYGGVEGVEDAS